jgi:hypothetical protein
MILKLTRGRVLKGPFVLVTTWIDRDFATWALVQPAALFLPRLWITSEIDTYSILHIPGHPPGAYIQIIHTYSINPWAWELKSSAGDANFVELRTTYLSIDLFALYLL